jgi:hypothetical protein
MTLSFGGLMRIALVIGLAVLCGACATVTPSGAEVHTSNGLGCVTPCTLTIKKNEEFIATFEKPGFIPQQVRFRARLSVAG